MRASEVSAAPTTAPSPGRGCSAVAGTPASCISSVARIATSGVLSAGLAITALPAASGPATSPTKMASGKFHGAMAATVPSGWSSSEAKVA